MNNKTNFLYVIIFLLIIGQSAFADVIYLNSGKKVEGKIIEKTDKYVKLDFQGIMLTFFNDEIKNIEESCDTKICPIKKSSMADSSSNAQNYKELFDKLAKGESPQESVSDTSDKKEKPKLSSAKLVKSYSNNKPISSSSIKKINKKVKFYVMQGCPACKVARQFLRKNNISFEEFDVERNRKAAVEAYKKSGRNAVPVFDIDGVIISGFREDKLRAALGITN